VRRGIWKKRNEERRKDNRKMKSTGVYPKKGEGDKLKVSEEYDACIGREKSSVWGAEGMWLSDQNIGPKK
jgi:hypothetical protein